jgi:NDP-sugar pyrophosphorylase family protein
MNILIPIAGRDKYFREEDFAFPKPLIDILGKPMIEHTINCFKHLDVSVRFTFVVQDELCKLYSLDNVLRILTEGHRCDIIKLPQPTQGAVCSSLMAVEKIDPDEELVVSNSDHVFRMELDHILEGFSQSGADVGLVTFDSSHPRWSYVQTDEDGAVIETSEKRVISREAIAGLYYFKRGSDFIEAAKKVILNGVKVNNAFYTSQVVNELILNGKSVSHSNIPSSAYFNLYSPQKVSEYEKIIRDERIRKGHVDDRPVLIVPAAGEGSRFVNAGYDKPKPFIDVNGQPMIERVLNNLKFDHMRTVVIGRTGQLSSEEITLTRMKQMGIQTIRTDALTEGTACTVLLARRYIDEDAPLIIANSDQLVNFDIADYVDDCISRGLDGSILCFKDETRNPKWSFAKTDSKGLVLEVKEKVAISDLATVGIYLFTKGSTFLQAATDMIANNDRVNNEFYTCPVYNYAIANGARIGVYEVEQSDMYGLGTPQDLETYLKSGVNL